MYIGVDTGGTFTDIVAFDPAGGRLAVHKVSSTPDDPARAVLQGVAQLLERLDRAPPDVRHLVHGTTVVTNAVLTGRWAPIALLTTQGFRDVLEIGRQTRPALYDFFAEKPEPLVPRARRHEVPERLDHRGCVLRPLEEAAVARLSQEIAGSGAQAVAVVLLFSYLNPAHERRVRELLLQRLNLPVVLSCETLPEFREYERTSTTALNAALVPVAGAYLRRLDAAGREAGYSARWHIMQSNGGVAGAELAAERPVTLLLSGPAGGVAGARFVGGQLDLDNLVTLDMGGTSCDVSLVHRGRVRLTSEGQVAGRPVKVPMADVHTIGAGGGSIAWVDAGGALRVGPQSAGADPGPVCYGRGGAAPTVTDAQLVLGRFAPDAPLGDIARLRLEAARNAIDALGRALGLPAERTAAGILAVADAHMERAIRLISVERGHDPRRFALLAFGGAGPLHACRLAERLGMNTVVVPQAAGVLSAFGLLCADLTHTFVQTRLQRLDAPDWAAVNAVLAGFRREAGARLDADAVPPAARGFEPALDLRYLGQSFELTVPAPDRPLAAADRPALEAAFHAEHERRYGHADPQQPVELVNVRLVARGRLDKPSFPTLPEGETTPKPAGARRVYFDGPGWLDCPCFAREALRPPARLKGPAVLDGAESTAVVPPGWGVRATAHGHLLLEVDP